VQKQAGMTAPYAPAESTSSSASCDSHDRGGRRILRVGIIHGRRIVEERLLARPGDVTIGTSPRSTFIVPWDDAPARWRLFEERGGRRSLHLAGGMTARIADGTSVTSIDGGAGTARAVPLSDRARGKVTIGDTTVLFQLLRPPAPQPRPQLPISVRHRMTDGIDRFFAGVVAFTLLLHVVLVVYLRQVDWPRRPDIEAVPDRFIHQIVRVPRPAPPPVAAPMIADATPKPAPRRPTPAAPAQRPASPDPKTREKIEAEVRQMGLLRVLPALAADGSSPITDVLGGGAVDRSLDEALKNVGGIAIASHDTLNGLQRPGGHGRVATPQDLRGGPGIEGARATGPVAERDLASRLKVDRPVIEGGRADLESITREIRARRKAIAACYERALKARPTLAGKLVVRFAITAAGTISTVDIDDDTLGAPEVGACVRAIVSRWRFAPPAEAPVELSFPFVFQAGS
jgi:outer membrane biosynthesis protein TonB